MTLGQPLALVVTIKNEIVIPKVTLVKFRFKFLKNFGINFGVYLHIY